MMMPEQLTRSVAPGGPPGPLFRVRLRRVRGAFVVRRGGRLARQGVAALTQAAAFPGQGQARDLPVHARGAVARRHVRLQAAAGGRFRQAHAPGPAARREAAAARPGSSASTARAASGSRSCFPKSPAHADELCVIRSMHTDLPAHPQAYLMMHTGTSSSSGRRSGPGRSTAWEPRTKTSPASSRSSRSRATAALRITAARFCRRSTRARASATKSRPSRAPSSATSRTPGYDAASQRFQLDLVQSMNRELLEREQVHPGVEGVIESYELAFRMQGSLPAVMDLENESKATKALYGIDDDDTADFGRQCLLARRFVEAGVRFVELSHGDWDQHRNLKADHARHARAVDKPIAGLLTDLKNARPLERHAGDLGRRVRPHAPRPERRRPRPQQQGLFDLDGRRRRQARPLLRPDRRPRLRGRREPSARPRLARHDPAPARPRPRAADLPLRRPRDAADRRQGKGRQGRHRLNRTATVSVQRILQPRLGSRRAGAV